MPAGLIRIEPVMCLNCAPCHSDTQGMSSAERNTWFAERRLVDIVVRRHTVPARTRDSSDDPPMHLVEAPLTGPSRSRLLTRTSSRRAEATRDPGHRQMRLGAVKPHLNQTPCSPAKFAQVFRTGGLACGAIQDAYNGFHRGRHLAHGLVRSMMCVTRQDGATFSELAGLGRFVVAFHIRNAVVPSARGSVTPVGVPLSGSRGVSGRCGR